MKGLYPLLCRGFSPPFKQPFAVDNIIGKDRFVMSFWVRARLQLFCQFPYLFVEVGVTIMAGNTNQNAKRARRFVGGPNSVNLNG